MAPIPGPIHSFCHFSWLFYLFYSLSVLSCSLSVSSLFYNASCPAAPFLLLLPFLHFVSLSASVYLLVVCTAVLSYVSGHVLRGHRQRSTHRCIYTHTHMHTSINNSLGFYFECSFTVRMKVMTMKTFISCPILCYSISHNNYQPAFTSI